MILIFLLHISSIFAKKENDGNSSLSENRNLYEIPVRTKHVNLFVQPRFNTSCDIESLEAAKECEAPVLNFCILKFFTSEFVYSQILHVKVTFYLTHFPSKICK